MCTQTESTGGGCTTEDPVLCTALSDESFCNLSSDVNGKCSYDGTTGCEYVGDKVCADFTDEAFCNAHSAANAALATSDGIDDSGTPPTNPGCIWRGSDCAAK